MRVGLHRAVDFGGIRDLVHCLEADTLVPHQYAGLIAVCERADAFEVSLRDNLPAVRHCNEIFRSHYEDGRVWRISKDCLIIGILDQFNEEAAVVVLADQCCSVGNLAVFA